jgi:hypothetical protein
MSRILTLTLHDKIDVVIVILDHRVAVGEHRADTGGQRTATWATDGWGSLTLGYARRKRETEPRRVEVREGGLGGPRMAGWLGRWQEQVAWRAREQAAARGGGGGGGGGG